MAEINKGTVTRYCKPSTLDDNGKPTGSSYQLRLPNEKYLSVYLLDFFDELTEQGKIKKVKIEMENNGFKLKKTGLFSTLDIEHSKDYIASVIYEQIAYKELKLPHCGIFHNHHDDLLIAELLSHCTKDCYTNI